MIQSQVVFPATGKGAIHKWVLCKDYGAHTAAPFSSEVGPDYWGKFVWVATSTYQIHPGSDSWYTECLIPVRAARSMLWLGIWRGGSTIAGSWSSSEELLGEGRPDRHISKSQGTELQWLLGWAASLKAGGPSDELSRGKGLQSFQVGFLGLGGCKKGHSNEASPVCFALACCGMYAANNPGLDTSQGQVEEHIHNQWQRRNRGTGVPNCLSRETGTDSASNFSWLLCCAFLVHISLPVNKNVTQACSITHASNVRKWFIWLGTKE